MTIQIINIFEKFLFKRYGKKYGIFHELFAPDQVGLEVRNLNYEKALFLKKTFLTKGFISYLKEKPQKGKYDFLTLGTISSLYEIISETNSSEHDELQTVIYGKLKNYTDDKRQALLFLEEMGLNTQSVISMGILNVTPDSFSDGGKYFEKEKALKHTIEMIDEGADIIDVGGVSTRPGAEDVSNSEESERVLPVIEMILKEKPETILSIDTTKSSVAEEALKLGVKIVNDISGGTFDKKMFGTVSKFKAVMVLMHTKGKPKEMQKNPYYADVVNEIFEFLETRIQEAKRAGIRKIIVDPGIGFGKRLSDNYEIISRAREFKALGHPLLIGLSRKSMLGNALNIEVGERDVPTVIAETLAVKNGADIIRTHNISYFNYLKKINNFINNPFDLENARNI